MPPTKSYTIGNYEYYGSKWFFQGLLFGSSWVQVSVRRILEFPPWNGKGRCPTRLSTCLPWVSSGASKLWQENEETTSATGIPTQSGTSLRLTYHRQFFIVLISLRMRSSLASSSFPFCSAIQSAPDIKACPIRLSIAYSRYGVSFMYLMAALAHCCLVTMAYL